MGAFSAGAGTSGGADWADWQGIAVRLRDSGRIGVVRAISADGAAASVALGSEDAEGRLQLPASPEQAETVCAAPPCGLFWLSSQSGLCETLRIHCTFWCCIHATGCCMPRVGLHTASNSEQGRASWKRA